MFGAEPVDGIKERVSVGMTIVYDASELNEISVLMRWRGTIMAMVLTRPVIWILVGIHYLFLHVRLCLSSAAATFAGKWNLTSLRAYSLAHAPC